MSIERAATDGSTIRNIAEVLLIRTARQPTDTDRMLEAIHSPAVKKVLSSNLPVRKSILEAHAQEPAAAALALVRAHWEPEAALRARGEPEAALRARAAHVRQVLAVRIASAAEISVAVLRSEIAAALVVAAEDSAAALLGRVAAAVLPASVAAEAVDVLAAVAVAAAHAEAAAVAEDEAEAGGKS